MLEVICDNLENPCDHKFIQNLARNMATGHYGTLDLPFYLSDDEDEWAENLDRVNKSMQTIFQGIIQIGSIAAPAMEANERIKKTLIATLAETQIDLSSVDAKPGDMIEIKITNDVGERKGRVLPISLHVKDFGWSSEVSPSFLFVKRLGVSVAGPDSVGDVTPRPVNFESASGSSLLDHPPEAGLRISDQHQFR